MTIKKWFSLLLPLMSALVAAQHDAITHLEPVLIADNVLKKFSNSQLVTTLNDSVLAKNQPSLTSLLNFNSTIYFKENGLAMVSSPSFRGTTAQQTAVVWNGININSQLNGQTDFNLINTLGFDAIAVRAGGGSTVYGSSAIGGSIHLNNELQFKKQFKNNVVINYGSFNSLNLAIKSVYASAKFIANVSFFKNASNNDYEYPNTNQKNQNGAFKNSSFSFNFGYKLNNFNQLKLYNQILESNRNLSGTLAADSKSNYIDFTSRTLIEWISSQNKFTSTVKLAFLGENYKYFEDKEYAVFSDGKAENFISRYEINFKATSKITLNSILDYTITNASGTSILQNQRTVFSSLLLVKHVLFSNFLYEFGVRKEITTNYDSPTLVSLGTKFSPFNGYVLRANISKNFRIPTFNDLYWQGQGNSNLQPEIANQAEIGHDFAYKGGSLSVTTYVIKITDMIQWAPNVSGVWSPKNVKNVLSKGIEINASFEKKYKNHHFILNSNYGYTQSQDQLLKKQLIYVPFHKVTFSTSYSYKNIGFFYQFLYNGKVFTATDHESFLPGYKISNAAIDYTFKKLKNFKLRFQVNNIFNQYYQNVAIRPMPGRNFNVISNFNF